jgi:carbamoyl-phosphate synthase small subunit
VTDSGRTRAHLVLADGTVFLGESLGAHGLAVGEAVFTTGMTGYQEVLTDPSYLGQVVTMTSPQIGNVGVNAADSEAVDGEPRVAGFVVRDASTLVSSWRAEESLDAYLARHGVVGITGVDTRTLTRHLRDKGAQNAALGTAKVDELARRAAAAPSMAGLDLVRELPSREAYVFAEGRGEWATEATHAAEHHVVAVDFGTKKNILRCLVDAGCRVTVVPPTIRADELLALCPDGVFLSNGPGDPAAVGYGIDLVRGVLGKKPLFGICLGHQLLALALGGRTYKLKFGHRGTNQPVKDLATGKVEITTQNHGFCVDLASLPAGVETTHVHLNDESSEGLRAPSALAMSVQYHPEAAAGPHDALYLFERFVAMMVAEKS